MREPLRKVFDEAEQRHADPQASYRAVLDRIEKPAPRPWLRPVYSFGGLAMLIVVGLASMKLVEPPPQVDLGVKTINGKAVEDGPDTSTLLSMCKSFSDTDGNTLDWARAIDACQKVLVADPINIDARKLKKLSEKEVAQKKIYEGAKHLLDLGEYQDAMQEYLKIDSDSFYYRLARSEFRQAAPSAMKNFGDLCLTESKGSDSEKAWADCKKMMDVGYYLGFEGTAQLTKLKQTFEELERRFKGKDDWTPRRDYERFLKETTMVQADRAERNEEIKKMYPDPEIAEAVIKYASDPNLGMQALQRYIGKGGKNEAEAKQVYLHMENATGSHQTGYERMLQFDLKGASSPFHAQLEADAQVMPKGFDSDLSKLTRRDISEKFAARSKELFQEGRLPDSFDNCQGGAEFQLGNPSVLECFSDLEDKAKALVDQGCEGAKKASAITRSDSPTHKKAEKAIKDNGCN
jgi:ABC transport system ATP-binding/permease protein